jgi:GNAT superfamily N-acetyltransferase
MGSAQWPADFSGSEDLDMQAEAAGAEMVAARVPAGRTEVVQALCRSGFLYMDTLVYLRRDVSGRSPDAPGCEQLGSGDADTVAAVARQAFIAYRNRYRADPRLDDGKALDAIVDWASRSCREPETASVVLGVRRGGALAGFAGMLVQGEVGDAVLFGVDPMHRGQGVFATLVEGALDWCADRGLSAMTYSTQIENGAVLSALGRRGFSFDRAYITLHKWYRQGR